MNDKIKLFERQNICKELQINRRGNLINRRGEHCDKVSSINSKISSLNAYFTYIENVSLKIKVIKCQKSLFGNKEKELTKYEFNKLYEAAKNNIRLKYLIETIAKTGARVSEVRFITVESIKVGKL